MIWPNWLVVRGYYRHIREHIQLALAPHRRCPNSFGDVIQGEDRCGAPDGQRKANSLRSNRILTLPVVFGIYINASTVRQFLFMTNGLPGSGVDRFSSAQLMRFGFVPNISSPPLICSCNFVSMPAPEPKRLFPPLFEGRKV
jgi:hypothetical protein